MNLTKHLFLTSDIKAFFDERKIQGPSLGQSKK